MNRRLKNFISQCIYQDSHIVNELLHRCNMSFFHNGTTVGVFLLHIISFALTSNLNETVFKITDESFVQITT